MRYKIFFYNTLQDVYNSTIFTILCNTDFVMLSKIKKKMEIYWLYKEYIYIYITSI